MPSTFNADSVFGNDIDQLSPHAQSRQSTWTDALLTAGRNPVVPKNPHSPKNPHWEKIRPGLTRIPKCSRNVAAQVLDARKCAGRGAYGADGRHKCVISSRTLYDPCVYQDLVQFEQEAGEHGASNARSRRARCATRCKLCAGAFALSLGLGVFLGAYPLVLVHQRLRGSAKRVAKTAKRVRRAAVLAAPPTVLNIVVELSVAHEAVKHTPEHATRYTSPVIWGRVASCARFLVGVREDRLDVLGAPFFLFCLLFSPC